MKTETYLYEILIRGTADGKIAGAHVVYMDRHTTDDGETIVEKPSAATGIDISQIEDILGKEFTKALLELPQARVERDNALAANKTVKEALIKAFGDALEALSK